MIAKIAIVANPYKGIMPFCKIYAPNKFCAPNIKIIITITGKISGMKKKVDNSR